MDVREKHGLMLPGQCRGIETVQYSTKREVLVSSLFEACNIFCRPGHTYLPSRIIIPASRLRMRIIISNNNGTQVAPRVLNNS